MGGRKEFAFLLEYVPVELIDIPSLERWMIVQRSTGARVQDVPLLPQQWAEHMARILNEKENEK